MAVGLIDVKEYYAQLNNLSCKDITSLIKILRAMPAFHDRVALVFLISLEVDGLRITSKFKELTSTQELEDSENYYYVKELAEATIVVNNLNGHDYSLLCNSNNISKNKIGNSNDAYNGYSGRNK